MFRYLNSLFQCAEKYKEEKDVQKLCSQISGLLKVPSQRLVDWLRYFYFHAVLVINIKVVVDHLFTGGYASSI